jgi:DNA repair photolyase
MKENYPSKFDNIKSQTQFRQLPGERQAKLKTIACEHLFTQQELKNAVDIDIDLTMWGTPGFSERWYEHETQSRQNGKQLKKDIFHKINTAIDQLISKPVQYQTKPSAPGKFKETLITLDKGAATEKIFGMCPVASAKTVCCNLRTIDAVKNCGFGCSYCGIQTMYSRQEVIFDEGFEEKLDAIVLDKDRRYHIGTGQSSDSLMWGNKQNILDAMLNFAGKWPNATIEFKTKSKNIKHLLQLDVPDNIVCSWSLNPQIVIDNEEHLTASFDERLAAARAVADKGIKVSFHFHPMVYFDGWQEAYAEIFNSVQTNFTAAEVLFISFGSLTFPKPIIKKIRGYGIQSRILQMPMQPNPEGKMTYPDDIKKELFKFGYRSFKQWHDKVFFYLCMEEKKFWLDTFGFVYETNEEFENALNDAIWIKRCRSD